MGRFNHGSGSGGGNGPRVITNPIWVVDEVFETITLIDEDGNAAVDSDGAVVVLEDTRTRNIGVVDTNGVALVLVRKF
jgi:hypothetical protein